MRVVTESGPGVLDFISKCGEKPLVTFKARHGLL